ncbi:MAG: hypothetical protein FGM42_03945 [Ilumatobacteraceae bacterium]|nr:hypothetical protein [Ilumatobacteraceae bacterium]
MTIDASLSQFLAAACPLVGDTGYRFYFTAETRAVGEKLGLNGMEFYVIGRGGPLGDCDGAALAANFGYFNPAVIGGAWESAKTKCTPRAAGRAHLECSAEFGRSKFASIPNLAAFVAAADAVNAAADPDGLGLYAAMKCEPLVSDVPGRAMQLATVLREFRGSAHLAAIRAAGLTSKVAHFIKRPNDAKMFGWSEDDVAKVTDAQRAQWDTAEKLTDDMVAPAYGVLDAAGREAFLAGITAMHGIASS